MVLVELSGKDGLDPYFLPPMTQHPIAHPITCTPNPPNLCSFDTVELSGKDGLDPTAASLLGGKPEQMLFLARNHLALTHKHGVNKEDFKEGEEGRTDGSGIEYAPGQNHQTLMTAAKDLLALSMNRNNNNNNNDHSQSTNGGTSTVPHPLSSLPIAKNHVVLARKKKRPGRYSF